jgi:hypothetical protein
MDADDDIPGSFEPVAWKDSMIFLATDQGPCQVQLWDTETRTLVRRYMFSENMYFGDMAADKERFWINLNGKKENLVQVNAASGEVLKIDTGNVRPRYVQYAFGALWVFDPHSPDAFRSRRYNREGSLEQSVTINGAIDHVGWWSIMNIDGEFIIPLRTFAKSGNRFYVANLSKGGVLTEIPLETLYPDPLLENISSVMYDSTFKPPDLREYSAMRWYTDAEGYADIVFTQTPLIWRWYYKVEAYMPLKLSGPIITCHREGDRSNNYFSKTGEYLFAGGFFKSRLKDGTSFPGIEISVYPAEGGEEIKIFRLWNAFETYVKRNGETWFSKDIWSWDYEKNQWNYNGETEAYILDEINLKLYRVRADGVATLVQE